MNYIPARRKASWLIVGIVYAVVLTLLLWINRLIVQNGELEAMYAFRFAMLAFVLSLAINGFGWLGARLIWLFSTIGVIVGLLMMFFYSSQDMTGWEDLSSLLGFFFGAAGGFALGLVVEAVYLIVKARRGSY